MSSTYVPFSFDAIPDMTGKVALVTGANSPASIGYHMAFNMAAKGATVYVGGRSKAKVEDGIRQMKAGHSSIRDDQLHPFVVDLADLKAVQAAAKEVIKSAARLDVLINNAGMAGPIQLDSHGISVPFKTNHLAPFVLTTTLLPLLTKTARDYPGVRVVTLSSSAHAMAPPGMRFDSLAGFNVEFDDTVVAPDEFTRYGLSKLANILFAKQLQKVLDAEGASAVSVSLHPGGIKTTGAIEILQKYPEMLKGRGREQMVEGMVAPPEGALTALFAATSPSVWAEKREYGGAYLVPYGQIETPSADAQNETLAKELWATSEEVVKSVLG